jgi:ATP-dependent DNA helicase 2 subunit 1
MQRAGKLLGEWKSAVNNDESANVTVATTGSKRKAVRLLQAFPNLKMIPFIYQDVTVDEAEIRSKYDAGTLAKVCSFGVFW